MTTAGQPVQVGGVGVGQPVQVGGAAPGRPVVVPGTAAAAIDDLTDVDAPPAQPGLLERQPDRTVRPVTREQLLAPHVAAAEPHPVYDDLPSLRILFENGLV